MRVSQVRPQHNDARFTVPPLRGVVALQLRQRGPAETIQRLQGREAGRHPGDVLCMKAARGYGEPPSCT